MNHIGLFEGIGGFSLAAHRMGWNTIAWCEKDEFCRHVLSHMFPSADKLGDIKKVNFSKYYGKIDILTGGFPCQPFSVAGNRKGKNDDRYLWEEMLRAIDEIRPTWVCGENVAGITSMVQPEVFKTRVESETDLFTQNNNEIVSEWQEYVVETICGDLERIGYSVQPIVIPACAIGAPHRRDRIWFIANDSNSRDESLRQIRKDSFHGFRNATDTISKRQRGESDRNGETGFINQTSQKYDWQDFPTQSPVCNGDDGIPARLDAEALRNVKGGKVNNRFNHQSYWRQESIKSGGNAIVHQIALEIFASIELSYNK